LRGTPGSVYPQPEPNATELPSYAPISAQTAQRQDGGGGGVARRARAARARKPKSCATSCGTSSTTPCSASFTYSPFTCRPQLSLGLPRRHRGDDRGGELQGLVFSTLHTPARALFYDAAKLFLNATTRASNVHRARDDEETVVDRVRVAAQQHASFASAARR